MTDTIETTTPEVDKKAALLASRIAETREVALPKFGFSVTVRGLTRQEALKLVGQAMPADVAERRLIALAMVDPVMTEEDVKRWQRNAPAGELQPIELAIRELSGLTEGAVKEELSRFPE